MWAILSTHTWIAFRSTFSNNELMFCFVFFCGGTFIPTFLQFIKAFGYLLIRELCYVPATEFLDFISIKTKIPNLDFLILQPFWCTGVFQVTTQFQLNLTCRTDGFIFASRMLWCSGPVTSPPPCLMLGMQCFCRNAVCCLYQTSVWGLRPTNLTLLSSDHVSHMYMFRSTYWLWYRSTQLQTQVRALARSRWILSFPTPQNKRY